MSLGFHPGGDLLYTSDLSGQFNLWRQPIGSPGAPGYPRLLTAYADRPVRAFVTTDDGRSVFFTADPDGNENHQIYRLWFDRGLVESVTNAPAVKHFLGAGSILTPSGEMLYANTARDPEDVDVIVHHLKTGAIARPFPPKNRWFSPQFDPRRQRILAGQFLSNFELRTFVLDRKRGSLVEILPHSGTGWVVPVDWTHDGRGIILLTDVETEFRRIVLHWPSTGKSRILAAPHADIENVRYAPRSGMLAYEVNENGYSVIYAGRLGGEFRRVRTPRGAIPPGIFGSQFEISRDGRFVAALWGTGTAPPEILLIPLRAGPSWFATDGMVGSVPDAPLNPPKLVRIDRPGERSVPAWYYLPKRRPTGTMPAVLSIHGGPNMQERPSWAYSGLYAFLNSRGIAVLAPNIRGSTGYGKTYEKLIQRDWGGEELEDLRACAEWLRTRPELDPDRLAVFGASFGGFASLSCLTRLPGYWKVGVDIFGPSNLVTFLGTIPPHWRKGMGVVLGDPEKDRDFLLSRSPITYLDDLKADLLVIQGAKDPRVGKAESDQLVERLRAANRKVTYLVFEDEGHGFSRQANQLKAYSTVAAYLVDNLAPGS